MDKIRNRNVFRQEYKRAEGWWEDSLNVKSVGTSNLSWDASYGGWSFTNVSNRYLYFNIQMQHAKLLSSPVKVHLHWMPSTTDTSTVQWELRYYFKNAVGDTAQGTLAVAPTETITVTPNGTAYVLQIDGFSAIAAPASETVSAILSCRLRRLGTEDDYNGTAILKDWDAHCQLDQPGSYADDSKWNG